MDKLNYLKKATPKTDTRPTLEHIEFDGEWGHATDGFRYHAVQHKSIPAVLCDGLPPAQSVSQLVEGKIPSILEGGKDVVFGVEANYLRDALPDSGQIVIRLVPESNTLQMFFDNGAGNAYFSQIMLRADPKWVVKYPQSVTGRPIVLERTTSITNHNSTAPAEETPC